MSARFKYLTSQKGDWKDWIIFILICGYIVGALLYNRDINALNIFYTTECLCPWLNNITIGATNVLSSTPIP